MSQTRRTVIIRADGNPQIGLGHIVRGLALAEMLADKFDVRFAIQGTHESVEHLLTQAGFPLIHLPPTTDYDADVSNLLVRLSGSELIILDGYLFDEEYQRSIKKKGFQLVVIDDLVAWHQWADVVINHAGNAKKENYSAEPYTKFLLGTDYAILRQVFLEAAQKPVAFPNNSQFENILVNLGGADPHNISRKVVTTLLTTGENHVTLILGAANQHRASFESLTDKRLTIKTSLSAANMANAILACDAAIVSCSTVSYEVAMLRRPFVGILTADNQLSLRDFYRQNHIALAVLEYNFTSDDLKNVLSPSLTDICQTIRQQQKFFDGRSGERLNAFFEDITSIGY